MSGSYEIFDHTADLGIRAWGDSPEALVGPAIEGLYAAIGELHAGEQVSERTFALTGEDRATLLRDLLAEVLYAFDQGNVRVVDPQVRSFTEQELVIEANLARVDESTSVLHREVKAVTYHELAVRKTDRGWEAVMLLDI